MSNGFCGEHFGAVVIHHRLVTCTPTGWRVRAKDGAILGEGPERGPRGFSLGLAVAERPMERT